MTRSHPKINSFLSTKNQTNQFMFICKRLNKINTAHPAQRADTQIFWHFELDACWTLPAIWLYTSTRVRGTFSRLSFFKVFLFQGFPFLCFPFSRGCPCCLEDSCSRALFQELLMAFFFFQKVTIADKISGLFRKHLFQDCSCLTFFKVMWGWL